MLEVIPGSSIAGDGPCIGDCNPVTTTSSSFDGMWHASLSFSFSDCRLSK